MYSEEEDYEKDYSDEINRFENSLLGKDLGYMDSDAFEFLIEFYLSKFNFEKADICSDLALKHHPSNSHFVLRRASFLIQNNKLAEANFFLKKIENIEKYNIEYYMVKASLFFELKQNNKAVDFIVKNLNLFNIEEQEDLLMFLAHKLFYCNKTEESLKYYFKAYNLNNLNEFTLNGLLNCYITLNRYNEGIAFFNSYIDDYPYSKNAWTCLSELYRNNNNYKKAIWALEFCLAIEPFDFGAIFQLACNFMYDEQYENAIEYFELYFENEQILLESDYCLLAECYENTSNLKKAKKLYFKALELNSDYADAWLGLGVVFDLEGDTKNAIYFIEKAIEIDSSRSDYLHILANAFIKIGEFFKAETTYLKALYHCNEDAEIFIDYFEFYMNQYGFKHLEIELKKFNFSDNISFVKDFIMLRSYIKRLEIEKSELFLDYLCQKFPEKINLLVDFYPDINEQSNFLTIINKYIK